MKLELTAISVAAILLVAGCGNYDRAPDTPSFTGLPASTALNSTTEAKIYSSAPSGKFLTYLVDWGDGGIETTATYVAGDTAEQWHTWHTAGNFTYRAMAYYTFDTTKLSGWSAGHQIAVTP
jgi:hypothetical protein